jgi:hypothetical protein
MGIDVFSGRWDSLRRDAKQCVPHVGVRQEVPPFALDVTAKPRAADVLGHGGLELAIVGPEENEGVKVTLRQKGRRGEGLDMRRILAQRVIEPEF